ncbi:kinase-like domain-containing protein [Amylostereum chailletii]|nr:kinase-like domain-containing protein [Amylostereum chailletii]
MAAISHSTTNFIGAVEDEWELFSDRSDDYTLGPPIGFGASSTVYRATYHPKNDPAHSPIPCALKVLDLDSLPQSALHLLQRETQMMSLSKHPNVLRVRGTWIDGHKIYIALRLMNAGSAADVMRYGWPGGMEEDVVRCILRQSLEGLNYLHVNGFIHRDIKAANLLIDDDGTVLLGDLGVAAPLHDEDHSHSHTQDRETGGGAIKSDRSITFDPAMVAAPRPVRPKRVGKRRSFVGTPCWMAPELISGKHYDSSADIWSFGITALELAQGRAPRSRESPSAVLLQTVHNASPTLDRDGGVHKYSRAFKELIDSCLVRDPSLRPTASQLLQMAFFKNAKRKTYLVNTILRGLPPLANRLERRRTASQQVSGTVDSWDFSTTLLPATPILSVGLHEHTPDGGVFEFDEALTPLHEKLNPSSYPPEAPSPALSAITSPSATSSSPPLSNLDPSSSMDSFSAKSPRPRHRRENSNGSAFGSYDARAPPRPSIAAFPSSSDPPTFSPPPPASPSLWSKIRSSTPRGGEHRRPKSIIGGVLGRAKALKST